MAHTPHNQRWMVLAILVLGSAAAANQPSKADVDQARQHSKAGEAWFRTGAFERAVEEYQTAYQLAPRPGFLFNIGSAYRKKAEASGSLEDMKRALEFYQRYTDADPAGKAVEDAKGFIAALRRDITAVEAARPTPPAPPAEPLKSVEAPRPAAPPPPPPPPVSAATPEAPPAPVGAPRDRGSTFRVAGLITAGVGVALVGTGVYFGLKARSTANDVDRLNDHWDAGLDASGASANRNMAILLGAGTAAIAGGAVLYFVLGHHNETAVSVAPAPMAGGGALVMSGRF